jgi:uncharacterized circularly permuted ATP-grasp superfamily protein/uncharacterized alpha-E superfamily protein
MVYRPLPGHYDEMMAADGTVRKHWADLIDAIESLGTDGLDRKIREARRILRDNGATYHAQKDAAGEDRPWPLDLIPAVITGAEWDVIESAVRQRARLLNEVLRDLYGPQRLLREGLLPPELVYAHPGFLRPCSGFEPRLGVWLTTYAVDLARSRDGTWRFLSDRTETPTGAGYTLENRLIANRVLAETFEKVGVRRLAAYFRRHRLSLTQAAAGGGENPRVALLTPGPASETYFEHAYLARYLGYTLVEGPDLIVRDQKVFLKTLGGLLPVDVLLRRQESRSLDPLEFSDASVSGTPGLLESIRAGNVAVANAPGSGLAESPALMAFLPGLARHFLNTDLELPSVPTWWCGQDGDRSSILARLGELVIKPAFPRRIRERFFARQMNAVELGDLRERILKDPYQYAAQEHLPLSTAPVATKDGLEPRYLVLRAFAIFDGETYVVMPGGLARVSRSASALDVSVLSGGSSKDLWVLGAEDEPPLTLMTQAHTPVDVSRATFDLPSRVAENLYWLGRYAERIDATARLVRAAVPLVSEESSRLSTSGLSGAFGFLERMGYARPETAERGEITEDDLEDEIRRAIVTSEGRGSFGWQIHHLRRLAWLLQDRLSTDAWKIISRLENDYIAGRANANFEHGLADLLDRAVINLTAFSGEVGAGMTRGHGWRLLDIGRGLERALQVLELLRHGLATVADDERARIELLLEAANVTITYRSRYLTSLQADLTIDLLLVDDANPRAVAFQLDNLRRHVEALPRDPSRGRRSPESRLVTAALAEVEVAELEDLSQVVGDRRPALEALLDRVGTALTDLSENLTLDYLTHAKFSRQNLTP